MRAQDALAADQVELKGSQIEAICLSRGFCDVLSYQFGRERAPGVSFTLLTGAADTIAQNLDKADLHGTARKAAAIYSQIIATDCVQSESMCGGFAPYYLLDLQSLT